jgi:hypothetical protein
MSKPIHIVSRPSASAFLTAMDALASAGPKSVSGFQVFGNGFLAVVEDDAGRSPGASGSIHSFSLLTGTPEGVEEAINGKLAENPYHRVIGLGQFPAIIAEADNKKKKSAAQRVAVLLAQVQP